MANLNTASAPGETGAENPRLIEVKDSISVPVVNKAGQEVGSVTIDPAGFGGKISKQLMHDVVLMFLANQRAGTHHTLRRGQVAGSSKKLFRQKGTGNARAGTKRTNKRRGGGTAKGPKPRDYEYHLPKKAVKAATRMAILSKFLDKEAVILDELVMTAPKTKEIVGVLKAIKVGKKNTDKGEIDVTLNDTTVLLGTAGMDENIYKSARNIDTVKVLPTAEFNCYTVLKHKRLLLTRAALEALVNPPKPVAAEKKEPKEFVRRGRAGRFQKRKKAKAAAPATK
jgi:large subunit ribosomal protein L4